MATIRKYGYDKRSERGEAGQACGVLLQSLSKGMYKWDRIVDAFVAERKMADGRVGYIPTVLFKGGYEFGQHESEPIFDVEEAKRVLGHLLATVKYILPEMLKTRKPSDDTMELHLFDLKFVVPKSAVEEIGESARATGLSPKELGKWAQAMLAAICPMGMTQEILDSLPEATKNEVLLLVCTMIAGDRYVLDETDQYWRSLHCGSKH